jgi:hypothetical protein
MGSTWMRLCAVLVLSLFGISTAGAAEADPLFQSNETLRVRLEAPLRELARDRNAEAAYRPATFRYTTPDGTELDVPIQVRPRGKSRRFNNYCQVPPLRLKFERKEMKGTLLEGQNNLKLVTYCRPSVKHDRFVQKEYLIYRMLNQVTDASFRVRALDIEYVDSSKPGAGERRFGYVIEDKGRLAKRLGMEVSKVERLSPDDLEPEHTALMELFEYMIANTDFSMISPSGVGTSTECCHNSAPMMQPGSTKHSPMLFDFDMSGFVNAPYAVVDGNLPINNVRQRLFRGFCRPGDGLTQAVARMQAARGDIFEVLRSDTFLDDKGRKEAVSFIESFYAILDDPKNLQRRVIGACRK